jgi:hypothetical protein
MDGEMQHSQIMKFKKGDFIVILVLVAAVLSWFAVNKLGESKYERQIVIETNGSVYKTIPMSMGMKPQDIYIELENGKHIDIVVDENGAYVKSVECPDKVCQKTGLVSRVGQSIVCLPNKVVVYIEGKTESEVDDISF